MTAPPPPPDRRVEQTLKVSAILVLLIGSVIVIWPFLTALLWAIVLCFTTWPVYARVLRMVGGRRTLAALLMTLGILLVLVAPFAIMGASLGDDIQRAAESVRASLAAGPPPPPPWLARTPLVGSTLDQWWRELADHNAQRITQLRQLVEPLRAELLLVAISLGRGLVELLLSLLIAFFLYRDGVTVAEQFTRAVERLGGEEGTSLLLIAGNTVRGVVYGILGTALVQSIIAGIGFAIARVPQAALLAFFTFFLSVVPIGPPLIWIPVAAWLFVSKGSVGWGVFMICWGILISTSDNVVKPLIISKGGAPLPFVLILMGVLGGALAFGFIGVFLGPTLLAIAFQLLLWWTSEHRRRAAAEVASPSSGAHLS
jgi:predicted PurR-regulated permease PerM